MCTNCISLPATKTSPTNGVAFTPTGHGCGTAIIDQKGKGKIAEYAIQEFHADGGRGFRLTKLEGGTDRSANEYNVFLADEAVADAGFGWDACDCKGFERHGHCKHVDAARAIVDRGLIGL
ncbi:MAG TPA: hypothetical protein VGL71_10150 [Urbifossiella sp.]|jgi:hypothetical protein